MYLFCISAEVLPAKRVKTSYKVIKAPDMKMLKNPDQIMCIKRVSDIWSFLCLVPLLTTQVYEGHMIWSGGLRAEMKSLHTGSSVDSGIAFTRRNKLQTQICKDLLLRLSSDITPLYDFTQDRENDCMYLHSCISLKLLPKNISVYKKFLFSEFKPNIVLKIIG